MTDPVTKYQSVLVPRSSKAAKLLNHALSVRNKIVVPSLFTNPAYASATNPQDVLSVPMHMYAEVINAYRTKLTEVKDKSYDLSAVTAHLSPLAKLSGSAADSVTGIVTFELVVHLPLAESLKGVSLKSRSVKVDEDDEEETVFANNNTGAPDDEEDF